MRTVQYLNLKGKQDGVEIRHNKASQGAQGASYGQHMGSFIIPFPSQTYILIGAMVAGLTICCRLNLIYSIISYASLGSTQSAAPFDYANLMTHILLHECLLPLVQSRAQSSNNHWIFKSNGSCCLVVYFFAQATFKASHQEAFNRKDSCLTN